MENDMQRLIKIQLYTNMNQDIFSYKKYYHRGRGTFHKKKGVSPTGYYKSSKYVYNEQNSFKIHKAKIDKTKKKKNKQIYNHSLF